MTRGRPGPGPAAAIVASAALVACSAASPPEAAFSAEAELSAADPAAEFAVPASVRSAPPDLVVVRSRIVRGSGPFVFEASLVDRDGRARLLGRAATYPAATTGDFAFAWPQFPVDDPLRAGAAVRVRFAPTQDSSPDLAVAVAVGWRRN